MKDKTGILNILGKEMFDKSQVRGMNYIHFFKDLQASKGKLTPECKFGIDCLYRQTKELYENKDIAPISWKSGVHLKIQDFLKHPQSYKTTSYS